MALTQDIELNGTAFNVVPGTYKKGLRKALTVTRPAARKIGTAVFGPFDQGLLQAAADDDSQAWDGLTVGPVFDGGGVEPYPNTTSFADATTDVPSTTLRAYGCIAGSAAYVGIGRRIYKSVALTNGTWSAFTVATDLGAGLTISGLSYFQDDILISLSTGQDIRKLNTATNAVTIWRTGEKSKFGVAYAGQFIYAPLAANNGEELRLSGTKWNGNAVTHFRYLDAPIVNMAFYNGKVAIATRKSLYFMGGQPYPGEQDDAAITGDSSRAPEWRGDPEPILTHGSFTEGDDFVFLESYRGKLYTWLGGRVAEFDGNTGEPAWRRMGPEATACYGATVSGDWLVVAIASRYAGNVELWGFNGAGWWRFDQRASPAFVWPCPLAGAGNRDLVVFRDGGGTYDLYRLRWRSSTLNTYASSGSWVSSVVDGGDPTADKAWRRIGATFATPGDRGNTSSVDSVSFPLEYSTDGGLTWVTVENTAAASGATRVLTRGHDYGAAAPTSRFLQLRQSWSSVSDWAPVLTSAWVEYENAAEYAIAEVAKAAYESGVAAENVLRRRWELTVSASDRNVKRDGQLDVKTGRAAITALWDAWETGAAVTFKDIDNDADPVLYVVSIVGMEEKAAKPADGARWGESAITLTLEEGSPGAVALPVGFNLDALADVALPGPLVDGYVLTYDSGTGLWGAEAAPGGGGGGFVTAIADTATVDLTNVTGTLSAAVLPAGVDHNSLANLATGDPHTQYALDTDLTAGLATKQGLDSDLSTIAGLTATTDNVIQSVASAWASRTPAQLKTTLALVKGDVGLGNVDNTSDANKPVSTAQAAALIPYTLFDAKGDLLAGTANDAGAKLTVGANGTYLKADSTAGTGLAWGTPGDVVGPAASVDSEAVLFSGTTGKLVKRSTLTGIVKQTAGVESAATADVDYDGGYSWKYDLAADTGALGLAIADVFPANSAVMFASNGLVYEFIWELQLLKTTAGTLVWTFSFGSQQAYISLGYDNGPVTGSAVRNVTANNVATPASGTLTTAVDHFFRLRGYVESANIGTMTGARLRVTNSAGTCTIRRGSHMEVKLVTANVGTFVA